MKNVYDIQQLLKRYGTFIYTGDRLGDLELMEMELDELYQMMFVQIADYQNAKLILKKEKRLIINKRGE
ncbi:YqgQ family protein [Oceanobacillus sp. FSL K6-2867]|uniref:YqgQ family protein n=1 Tax=Oceanobacillus sp. FSL K6-2867 TaxID=2954748 RepID=UPI0030D74067